MLIYVKSPLLSLLLFLLMHSCKRFFMWHLFMKPLLQTCQQRQGWALCMVFLCRLSCMMLLYTLLQSVQLGSNNLSRTFINTR